MAHDPNTGNALAFLQLYADGSAAYWLEPLHQARVVKDRAQAEFQALLPIAEALADLGVYDAREVRLYSQPASAMTGSASLALSLQHAARAKATVIAFAGRKDLAVEGAAVKQLLAAGAREATLDEYDEHVSGGEV